MIRRTPRPLDIRSLRRREVGTKAFIVANGPSVNGHDLSHLAGRLVIGMNATPLLEAEHGFRSRYYCVSDRRFISHPEKRRMATETVAPDAIRVLRADLAEDDDPALLTRTAYVRPLRRDGFSPDLSAGFFFGSTTALLAVQLAYYLGCRSIVLLGCDYHYPPGQPRFYPESDPCPEDPMLSVQIRNMADACAFLAGRGVEVVSCSSISALRPYVPTVSFETALEG